jgi:hypothetical protein
MQWAIVNEDRIMAIQAGSTAPEWAVILPDDHQAQVGENVKVYTGAWKVRPLSELVAEGFKELPKGTKLDGEKIVPMTDIEKYKAGVEEIPKGMKIVDDAIVSMTTLEQVDAGQITKEEAYERASEWVRLKRNTLLAETDWTQLPDSPVDPKAVQVYRQELRDITKQAGFPFKVVWPEVQVDGKLFSAGE